MKRLELRTLTVVVGLTLFLLPACAPAPAPDRTRFNNPDDAASALMKALKNNNAEDVKAIFGPNAEALSSGDPVSDRNDRHAIALAMESSWRWEKAGAERMELIIGDEQWPFPVPLAEVRRGWQFDTDAGKEEVLSRRIGRNELRAIGICRKSVTIQKDTRVSRVTASAPACMRKRWRAPPDARTVSTGERAARRCRARWEMLVAQAIVEGYDLNKDASEPLWGYRFRVLTAQGSAAKGGAQSYLVNGEMSGGFGLIAYPDEYGRSGIMTFMVNQDGVVYEKDLGEDTIKLAPGLKTYDPDNTWAEVKTAGT